MWTLPATPRDRAATLLLFAAVVSPPSPVQTPLNAQTAANGGDAPTSTAPAPVQLSAREDHQRLMELLKISALRPGANGGNPRAKNAANYDESKANPFPKLPDPLKFKDGTKVASAADWWERRRPEIVEDFDREIYGRVPPRTPNVRWEIASTKRETLDGVPVITKALVGRVDNAACPSITVAIQLTLSTPANAPGPVPVMMEFGFGPLPTRAPRPPAGARANASEKAKTNTSENAKAKAKSNEKAKAARPWGGPPWRRLVLKRGWGWAVVVPYSVQADNGGGLTRGIIGLCNRGQPRGVDDWGALRAWAWGASRALDYFETDRAVDARRVGVEGHSRYGKAALVAMAYDQRFAIAYISSSGEGGAKLHRRAWGELVENVAGTGEYHWMAGNFLKYAGPLGWDDLPVDSHELIALCAPRPVFIGAGATRGDGWVDAKGSFLAAAGAGPVYKLLGKKGLGTDTFPPIETALIDGDLAFRQHAGGHTPGPNWPTFLAFAGRYWKGPPHAPAGR